MAAKKTSSFVKNKGQFQVYIQSMGGGPANHGRPISDEDLEVIASELRRNPLPPAEAPHLEETAVSMVTPGPGARAMHAAHTILIP